MIKNLFKKVKQEVKVTLICAKYNPIVASTRRTIKAIKNSIAEKEQEITKPKSTPVKSPVEEDVMGQEKTDLESATDNVYNIFMNFLNNEECSGATPATNFGNVKLPKDFDNIYNSTDVPPSSSLKHEKDGETTGPKVDNPTILKNKESKPSSIIWERFKCLFCKNKGQFLKLLKNLFNSFKTFISTVLIILLSSLSVCVLSIYTLARELFSTFKTFCITLDLKPNMSV